MNFTDLENEDWQPEDYFARVAEERRMTPEQLRARLRGLVDHVAERRGHLSFELLRDATTNASALCEQDLAHLDRCDYCSRFLQTVNPSVAEVARFVKAAEPIATRPAERLVMAQAMALPVRTRAPRFALPLGMAAVFALGVMSVVGWNSFNRNSSPVLATAEGFECSRASGNSKACALYEKATKYQAAGDLVRTHQYVTRALQNTGVDAPVVGEVQNVLRTIPVSFEIRGAVAIKADEASARAAAAHNEPKQWLESARLHLEAGEELKAYDAVNQFLKVTIEPKQALAFEVGFFEPVKVREINNTMDAVLSPADPADPKAPKKKLEIAAADTGKSPQS